MFRVGLTGGIGCGKSSAVRRFQAHGVGIVDADAVARAVVQPGEPALVRIVAAFGPEAVDAEGRLDRAWMRARVFQDPEERVRLEQILHPLIRERLQQQVDALATQPGVPYVLVDVPLLVEHDYQPLFERIVVVDCTSGQQLQRIRHRDGSDDAVIAGIIRAQAARKERLGSATDVLDNTASLESLYRQVDLLHEKFLAMANGL
ncbi:MAG: dephospho-CoA kinase [Thiothrix sp.]|nr:dephospho-CoA kinase [Thiothrix sp.]HPE59596.1 dephospho-CoA kinase [Thiolinea sp.]